MDKKLLAKAGRRLHGKSHEGVRWENLTEQQQREWIKLAARAAMILVEPRFSPLIAMAKSEVTKKEQLAKNRDLREAAD